MVLSGPEGMVLAVNPAFCALYGFPPADLVDQPFWLIFPPDTRDWAAEQYRQVFRAAIVPAAFATVFAGFLMLTTRQKAITQVVGYMFLDNGIFLFGLLLIEALPILVELGVLLDLVVGVFVMGIIMHRIQRTFSTIDTARFSTLKE